MSNTIVLRVPPIPLVINVIVRSPVPDVEDFNHHHHQLDVNEIPIHPRIDAHPVLSMNGQDDDTISVISSIIDIDDRLTIETFRQDDGESLVSFVSPPLVMGPWGNHVDDDDDVHHDDDDGGDNDDDDDGGDNDDDDGGDNDDDDGGDNDDDGLGATIDNTEAVEIFQSMDQVRQTYPLAIPNGRGATNVHDANYQSYIAESRLLQSAYQTAHTHTEKWMVERQLIDSMERQGRMFIRRNNDGTFQLMSQAEKREKVQKRLYVRPSMRNVNVPLPPPVPQAPPPPHAPLPLVPQPAHVPQHLVPPPVLQALVQPVPPDVASQPSEKMEDNDSVSMKTNLEGNDVLLLPSPSFLWGIDFLDNPSPVLQLPPLVLPDVNSHWMEDNISVLAYNSYHLDLDFILDDPPLFPPNAFSLPLAPLPLSEPPQVPQVLLMEDDDSVSTSLYSFLFDMNFLDD